jgi:hypothetical protein
VIVTFLILSNLLFLYSLLVQYKKYNYLIFAHVGLITYFLFLLYYSIPLLFNIYFFESYSDEYRLKILNINYEENIELVKHIFIGSLGFALVYIFQSKKKKEINLTKNYSDYIYYLFFLIIVFYLLKYFFNSDFEITSRLSSFKFIKSLPRTNAQILKFISVTYFYLEVIFYFEFCRRFGEKKKIVYLFIISFLIINFFNIGLYSNRSELFIKLIVIIIAFNLYVRKINLYQIAIIVIFLISFLIIWGNLREYDANDKFMIKSIGEFDMIYANFFDILRRAPHDISLKIKFFDFYSFFPGQFLPFEKKSLSDWFMTNFHYEYYDKGGGYGFGILAESLTGWGILETFIKIFFLSFILDKLFKIFINRQTLIYRNIYIILIITCPLSIRVSAFYFMYDLIQFSVIFIIFFLFFFLLSISSRVQNLKK